MKLTYKNNFLKRCTKVSISIRWSHLLFLLKFQLEFLQELQLEKADSSPSSRIPIRKEDGFQFYNRELAKNAAPLLFQGWVIVEQSLEACTSLLLCWSTVKLGVFEVLQKKICILFPKLFYLEIEEKLLKFEAEGREFPKIIRTIYSNSERFRTIFGNIILF